MGIQFRNATIPVADLLVSSPLASSASTKTDKVVSFPLTLALAILGQSLL